MDQQRFRDPGRSVKFWRIRDVRRSPVRAANGSGKGVAAEGDRLAAEPIGEKAASCDAAFSLLDGPVMNPAWATHNDRKTLQCLASRSSRRIVDTAQSVASIEL